MANDPRLCRTGCGRPVHADGLCKTHHQKGEDYEIRPYLPRDPRRCEYAGIPVLKSTRRTLVAAERQTKMAARALVGSILDAWAGKKLWSPMLSRAGLAATAALVVAGSAGLRCAPQHRAEIPSVTPAKGMPEKHLDGQATPPCEKPLKAMVGGCWVAVIDPDTGRQVTGCLASEMLYQDDAGKCWVPAWKKPPKRQPTSLEDAASGRQ